MEYKYDLILGKMIEKDVDGGITYAEGSKMKKFVWESKAGYDYFPFASKASE